MQTIKRVIKKIGAISTGAIFVGASLMGAMAADLGDYPAPFISGGAYDDVALITSSNGMDANSALLITNAFAGLITATGTSDSTSTTSVAGAYQLSKSGNKFNFDDDAYDLDTKLDKNDLDVLADGEFSDSKGTNKGDYDFTQKIEFSNNKSATDKTVGLIFDKHSEGDKLLSDYLYLSKTSNFYAWTYTWDLSTTLTVADSADINNNVITVLGQDYTIISSTITSGNVTKITLLAGDVTQTLKTGETVSGVKLTSVDLNGAKCTIEYEGSLYTIDNSDTETMADGTIIGVTDVVATSAGLDDYCELNIGANKVELEDTKKVKVNGDEIDNSKVNFMKGGLDYFNVTYIPEDKVYLESGDSYEDPVFGAFKIMYEGLEETSEDIELSAEGEQVTLKTTNKDGDVMFIDLCYSNDSVNNLRFGGAMNEQLIVVEGDILDNESVEDTTTSSDIDNLEGTRFLYSKSDYAHIVEIDSIDTTNNKTDFDIIDDKSGTPENYDGKEFTPEIVNTFDFLANTFQLNISYINSEIVFTDINDKGSSIFTEGGANITFMGLSNYIAGNTHLYNRTLTGNHTCYFTIEELDNGKETDLLLNRFLIDFTYDTSGNEINLNTVNVDNNYAHNTKTLLQLESGVSTTKGARTVYGTYIEKYVPSSGSGEDTILFQYPDEATYGLVYFAPTDATASTTVTGSSVSYVSLEDTEVTSVTAYNAIVVGGPAANSVAADLLGLTYPAYAGDSGLSEGDAILKLVDNGDNVALIVYGWEKDDTKRAAKVLESYSAYEDLVGEEVSVTGTVASPTIVTAEVAE